MKPKLLVLLILLTVELLLGNLTLRAQRVVSVNLCQKVIEEGTVPVNIQNQFFSDTPEIHAVVILDNVKAGMVVKGAWISVDAINVPNYQIDAAEVRLESNGSTRAHFSITRPNNNWPTGHYKFNLYVDGKLITVSTFTINAGNEDESAPGGWEPAASDAPPSSPGYNKPNQTGWQSPQSQQNQTPSQDRGASGYSGRYTLNSQGTVITLVLQQDINGTISGSLSSTTGINFQIQGELQGDAAIGTCTNNQGGVYFEAHLQGNQLQFYMIEPGADGMPNYNRVRQLMFARVNSGGVNGYPPTQSQPDQPSQRGNPGYQKNRERNTPSGNEYQLQGKFCTWSGSSSSYSNSSYSSSQWAYFDGQGSFSYGSESSFSSDDGLAYGSGPGGERGTYRITGNQVYLTFADGSQGVATVHMRQNDGRITELMYEGDLYAAELCE